ncbi:MAP kinase kinase [Reticulomyxa filosa]|uniref:mitogen-activated protein kinase kinase n=1 Tax=Reticulomyxa filosa TaxID=46433 RepID=X6M5U2_RETFI|nr:MAP kinase kinase [Reticulomyxa filosa]|eukprot:ETO09001.1 MAP kinase kinase [Reticulomyxa filosa]
MWEEPFGKGASARVYKAMFLPLCLMVAAKVTSRLDMQTVKQILEEYEAQVTLLPQCDQLMKIYGWYRNMNSNEVVILLEYMDMGSVCDSCFPKSREHALNTSPEEMERSGHKQITLDHLTVEQLRFIARQVLLGLFHLHNPASSTKPLIHRDIKPQNILLSCNGDVKIADFGLLYQLQSPQDVCTNMDGTMKYFAPERANANFSTGADIWALGITMIEIYLQQLLPAEDLDLFTIVEDGVHLDKYFDSKTPLELVSFVKDCLTQDPAHRPSAFDLLHHTFITNPWGPPLLSTSPATALRETREHPLPLVKFAVVEKNQKTLDQLLQWLEQWILQTGDDGVPNSEIFEKGDPEDMKQCVANLAQYSGFSPNFIDTYIADVFRELIAN